MNAPRRALRHFLGALLPGRRIWLAVVLTPAGVEYGRLRFTWARAYLDSVDWSNRIAAGDYGFTLNRCTVLIAQKGDQLHYPKD